MNKTPLLGIFLLICAGLVSALPVWEDLSSADTESIFPTLLNIGPSVIVGEDLYFFGQYNSTNSTQGRLFVYNYSSNTISKVDEYNIFLTSTTPVFDGVNTVYVNARLQGASVINFASLDLNTKTWTDYGNADTDNWVNNNLVNSIALDSSNGLVYTGLNGGKLGVYDISNGVWTSLSSTDTDNWIGNGTVSYVTFDSIHNLLYLGVSNSKIGVYDPLTNITTQLTTVSGNNAGILYDGEYNGIYTPNAGNVSRYDINANTTNILFNIKPLLYPLFIKENDGPGGKELIYVNTGRTVGRIYSYVLESDFNATMLDQYIVNNWISNASFSRSIAYDDINDRLYTLMENNGVRFLGVYYDPALCKASWTQSNTECDGHTYTIQYIDTKNCNTTINLPADNGTTINCCVEDWNMRLEPEKCIDGNQIRIYSDANSCGTTNGLPEDNGTAQRCCIEKWIPQLNPLICTKGSQQITYTDANNCGTSDFLPQNNGSIQGCCVEEWIQFLEPNRCSNGSQQILYHDRKSCGTTYALPTNNGTHIGCDFCVENWFRELYPKKCTTGTQAITYTDLNRCGTSDYLPADNGTIQNCCLENWVKYLNPDRCLNGTQQILYNDRNLCNTAINLPANNGTLQTCKVPKK